MTEPKKKTPLYEKHLAHKGTMVDYSGWLLPVQFEGIIAEVRQTRQKAGIFDVSHMGEFMVEGSGAAEYLQKLVTNDIATLPDSAVRYSPVCYPHGGTVDDILIYRYNREQYLLVVNAANAAKDLAWFKENLGKDVVLADISSETAEIALQGPNSLSILSSLTNLPLDKLRYYHFIPAVELAGVKCLVSRTGYTGEDGFEIYCPAGGAPAVWEALWQAGRVRELGLTPAGLGARDILRLEAGLPLYGHELSETLTPLDAGLDRFVSFKKPVQFIGREALLQQKRAGTAKKLAGLIMLERGVIREGYAVTAGGQEIGWVSSGTYSPTFEKSLGMAYLDHELAVPGEAVEVIIRERAYPARVVKTPFYRRDKNAMGNSRGV